MGRPWTKAQSLRLSVFECDALLHRLDVGRYDVIRTLENQYPLGDLLAGLRILVSQIKAGQIELAGLTAVEKDLLTEAVEGSSWVVSQIEADPLTAPAAQAVMVRLVRKLSSNGLRVSQVGLV